MSNFRKFTEFCAGISAFTAIIYVFRQYMSYSFEEEVVSFRERLKIFFDVSSSKDMRSYMLLACLLILAIAISLSFKKFPEISFFFSALPLFYTVYLYDANKLYEKPMIFICLSVIQVTGNIYDTLNQTRTGKRHSALFTSFFATALPLLFCLTVIWRRNAIGVILIEELYPFDRTLYMYSSDYDTSLFSIIAVMYGVLLLVSLLLRGVHFIDFALSLAPLCFVLYKQAVGELGPFDEIIMVAAILCTLTHLALTIGGTRRTRKETF